MGKGSRDNQGHGRGESQHPAKRSWTASIAFSVVVVGVGILISATVNPLFGRAVHWDWMAVLAPVLFVTLTMVLRNRWA
jgi:energy-converting hydrogenase Eha subunit A